MIKSELEINLEGRKDNQFSQSVLTKIQNSGDLNKNFEQELSFENISITQIRRQMGKKNIDFSNGNVDKNYQLINKRIEVGVYRSKILKDKSDKVLYFIHGGGFVGGNFFQYENQIKLIVEQTGCTLVAINYRLAPENPFPAGLLDCFAVYQWIVKNAGKFGWSTNKIIMIGDSAGVNLGIMLALNYPTVQFYSIINIYGCVDNTPTRNQKYRWSLEKYHILPDQEEILNSRLLKFKQQMDFFNKLYFSSELATKKIYKNILNCDNYVNIPRMLYIEAEFDYFRWSNRYLINEKLQETCVDIIMFKGVDHGFFERLGFCNETLICINKISQYINHI